MFEADIRGSRYTTLEELLTCRRQLKQLQKPKLRAVQKKQTAEDEENKVDDGKPSAKDM